MGLFDFMKKQPAKQQQPSQKDFDLSDLNTDLPPLIGAEMPQVQPGPNFLQNSFPSFQNTASMPAMPAQNMQSNVQPNILPQIPELPADISAANPDTSKSSLTVNMPSLDFIMPSSDDHEDINNELNKLFLSDPQWKEPDWNTFEPYSEPEIEHPTSQDFGVASPSADLPEFKDIDVDEHRTRSSVPVDVYVNGADYARVFSELMTITNLLKTIDPKIEQTSSTISKEEIMMKDAKDEMEYVYKKLMQIEKKIFVDA